MRTRDEERIKKQLNKSLTRLMKFKKGGFYVEDNKERLECFKYYSGWDSYKEKRVVRSIGLSKKLDDFISEIQREAKEVGNFVSKNIIINIALYQLYKEYEEKEITNFNEWIRLYLK